MTEAHFRGVGIALILYGVAVLLGGLLVGAGLVGEASDMPPGAGLTLMVPGALIVRWGMATRGYSNTARKAIVALSILALFSTLASAGTFQMLMGAGPSGAGGASASTGKSSPLFLGGMAGAFVSILAPLVFAAGRKAKLVSSLEYREMWAEGSEPRPSGVTSYLLWLPVLSAAAQGLGLWAMLGKS